MSPWYSLPDFLKEPMLAMSLLLCCSNPRPSRPRWRSAGRRRAATHPLAGRSTAEDGGGETFLPREEWAKPRGRKSIRPPLRHRRSRRSRPPARSSHGEATWLAFANSILGRRRGGHRIARTRDPALRAKEKKRW